MTRSFFTLGSALAFGLASAALVSSIPIPAQAADPLRVCTGGEKGNYFYFGAVLAKTLGSSLPVKVIPTKGSMENLQKLAAGECDAAVAQSDAVNVYQSRNSNSKLSMTRVGSIFDEALHLACNTQAEIEEIGDLSGATKVAIGEVGSGSWVSWQGLVQADKVEGGDSYSGIPTDSVSGSLAINRVVDGADTQCLFFVSSMNSDYLAQLAAASQVGGLVDMAEIVDKDFNDTVDPHGKSIYTPTSVSYEGFGHWGSTDTLAVSAIFFVADAWINANPGGFETVNDVFLPVVANVKAAKGLN